MIRNWIRILIISFSIIGAIGVVGILYYVYLTSPYEVTECLQSGGKWDEEKSKCLYE